MVRPYKYWEIRNKFIFIRFRLYVGYSVTKMPIADAFRPKNFFERIYFKPYCLVVSYVTDITDEFCL